MLILTRKVGESLALGDRIVIKVLDIQGRKVQLGVEAPDDVRIVRQDRESPPREPHGD